MWDLKALGDDVTSDKFLPRLTEEERDLRFERWKLAVKKSLGWLGDDALQDEDDEDEDGSFNVRRATVTRATKRLYASIPGTVFAFTSFLMWMLSERMASASE